jgi:mono/diheme cytochrome c family protein
MTARPTAAVTVVAAAAAAWLAVPLDAHKPITSKYTYNQDVFPVVRERCGRCHVKGGVGPMSLLTYKDAFPWAEAIRQEMLTGEMPPWHADEGFGRGITLHTLLSPRELDVLLTWSTGGTPQGPAASLPAIGVTNDWSSGKPDLILTMPEPFVLAPDAPEATHQFVVGTGLDRPRVIRAIDFRPGNPAMVRHAVIALAAPTRPGIVRRATAGAPAAAPGAEWTPGSGPRPPTLTHLPAAALLQVTIHYKRTWTYEGTAMSDRSQVGIYFTEGK